MPQSSAAANQIDQRVNQRFSMLVGVVALGLVVYGLYAGGRAVYRSFSPPPTISLGADLEASESQKDKFALHVTGAVQRSGKLLDGQVVLGVQELWSGSPQTITIPVIGGKFELRQNPQFVYSGKNERLLITAEAWAAEAKWAADAEIYLNSSSIWRYKRVLTGIMLALIAVLATLFFWVFTGHATPLKNRIAIMLSYCIMLLFLALPLSITNIALVISPDQLQRMEPVGIGMGKAWGAKADDPEQWVLNIGGHVTTVPCDEGCKQGDEQSGGTPTEKPTPAPAGAKPDDQQANAGGATAEKPVPAPAGVKPDDQQQAQAGNSRPEKSTSAAAGSKPGDQQAKSGEAAAGKPGAKSAPAAKSTKQGTLEGGLAIPLYVLVLAVIGGAINMARKIPEYHQAGEESVIEISPLNAVRGFLGTPWRASLVSHQTQEAGAGSVGKDQKSDADDKKTSTTWRKGLLDQYMYLISAPFLAIVTYFLMMWMGTSTVPALVLVSFSVGLITEPVVQLIIATAQKLLSGKNKNGGTDGEAEGVKAKAASGGAPLKKAPMKAGEKKPPKD